MADANPPPPRLPELHAVSLIQDAKSYRKAAAYLAEAERQSSHFSLPVYFLLCHASELALKAFLASQGMTERQLKHVSLRHNLRGLYEAALPHGFKPPDDDFGELMDWLSEYHSDFTFRYRPPGGRLLRLPAPQYVAELLEPVIAGIEKVVRARYFESQNKGGC